MYLKKGNNRLVKTSEYNIIYLCYNFGIETK